MAKAIELYLVARTTEPMLTNKRRPTAPYKGINRKMAKAAKKER